MKKEAEDKNSLEGLVGKIVQVWCVNFIYSGKLEEVTSDYLRLSGCGVVYETGELTAKKPKTYEPFASGDRLIMRAAVESLGVAI